MSRKNLKLEYISNGTLRKQSFDHRKKVLMKKLDELKILCGVDACAVIYEPFNTNPEVWPSLLEVNNVIEKFTKLTSEEQMNRSVNHQEFLNQYIEKIQKRTKKQFDENNEECMKEVMFKCLGGKMKDFHMNDNERHCLCKFIDQYLKELLHHKNVTLCNPHFQIGESSSMAMVAMAPPNMAPTMSPIPALMAPTTMDEASSSSFLNVPSSDSTQLTNKVQCIDSSNQELGQVYSLATNLLPNNDQELCIPSVDQSMIPSYQGSEDFNLVDFNNQEVYIPVMDQDEFYYPNQKENHQKGFVDEMMKCAEGTGFPWMEDNHHA